MTSLDGFRSGNAIAAAEAIGDIGDIAGDIGVSSLSLTVGARTMVGALPSGRGDNSMEILSMRNPVRYTNTLACTEENCEDNLSRTYQSRRSVIRQILEGN